MEVTGPVQIIDGVTSTGEMGSAIIEQSLILSGRKGTIVLTGCAHPGIEKIVARAKELSKGDILLVMGGFHLLRTRIEEVRAIAESFYSMNIRYVAPTHCSGDGIISEFKNIFGNRCLAAGAGRVIMVDEL